MILDLRNLAQKNELYLFQNFFQVTQNALLNALLGERIGEREKLGEREKREREKNDYRYSLKTTKTLTPY